MPEDIPQVQVTTSNKTSWKKIILTVLIIIVVSGLIIGAYWFFALSKGSETSDLTGPVPKLQVNNATPTATPSATSSTQKDETADWKTYYNKKLGFSLKHPNNWFYEDIEKYNKNNCSDQGAPNFFEGLVFFDREEKYVKCVGVAHTLIYPAEFVVDASGVYTWDPGDQKDTLTTLTIGGVKAEKIYTNSSTPKPNCKCATVHIFTKGIDYYIYMKNKDYNGNYDPIYNIILSTFKFLD